MVIRLPVGMDVAWAGARLPIEVGVLLQRDRGRVIHHGARIMNHRSADGTDQLGLSVNLLTWREWSWMS
jgi:hypothetical protein